MLVIDPTNKEAPLNDSTYQIGDFTRIIILTEEDLGNLYILCGQDANLVIVPRDLTEKETKIVSDTLLPEGRIVTLKDLS